MGCPTEGQSNRSWLTSLGGWTGSGKFTLGPLSSVLSSLGNPEAKLKRVIHVTGTNGKGSTSLLTASILAKSGKRVALFTSPHLQDIEERIILNGATINPSYFDNLLGKVRTAAERSKVELSQFEAITASFFCAAAERDFDYCVVEVGLGGRLDATNLIPPPLACVLTSISADHENVLGEGLIKIAQEKAGIIKAKSPVFIGQMPVDVAAVVRGRAKMCGSAIYQFGVDFQCRFTGPDTVEYESRELTLESRVSLKGQHQASNIGLAITISSKLGVEKEAQIAGLGSASWPGRLESIYLGTREVLLDCAHNLDGIGKLVEYLEQNNLKNLTAGFGILNTKNWKSMIDCLEPYVKHWCLLDPPSPAAVKSSDVSEYLTKKSCSNEIFSTDYKGFIAGKLFASDVSPALVTGSIYLVGEVRKHIAAPIKQLW